MEIHPPPLSLMAKKLFVTSVLLLVKVLWFLTKGLLLPWKKSLGVNCTPYWCDSLCQRWVHSSFPSTDPNISWFNTAYTHAIRYKWRCFQELTSYSNSINLFNLYCIWRVHNLFFVIIETFLHKNCINITSSSYSYPFCNFANHVSSNSGSSYSFL